MTHYNKVLVGVLCLAMLTLVGCGGGSKTGVNPTGKDKLSEIANMLKLRDLEKQKPPANLNELTAVEPMLPTSGSLIRSGEIVYFWGATISTGGNAANTILAYEKAAATDNGWVLMQDGTVKTMSAAEFGKAAKAGK